MSDMSRRKPRTQFQRHDDYRFGRLIYDERTRHGWSQTELAERASEHGMPSSVSLISAVETGKRSVTLYEAGCLMVSLHLNQSDAFGLEADAL